MLKKPLKYAYKYAQKKCKICSKKAKKAQNMLKKYSKNTTFKSHEVIKKAIKIYRN
jgi:hypothetical protein